VSTISIQSVDTDLLLSQQYRGIVTVPANFSLSFDLTPLGTVSSWSSIIHYSATKEDLSRIPAIWFNEGKTSLRVCH
jgi:hypothetical protein